MHARTHAPARTRKHTHTRTHARSLARSQTRRANGARSAHHRALPIERSHLSAADLARVTRLERLDELEEWVLIQRHYCLVLARKGGAMLNGQTPGGLAGPGPFRFLPGQLPAHPLT
jgi:hypothetical protein